MSDPFSIYLNKINVGSKTYEGIRLVGKIIWESKTNLNVLGS